jgi:hypothetical protein
MKRLLIALAAIALAVAGSSTGTQPSNHLGIDFTNRGEGPAYIHWSLPPGLTSSPSSVNFGTVNVGSQMPINIAILNDGPAIIQLQPMSIAGQNASDFSFASQCTAYLDPNGECNVTVTFKPTATGPRSATLSIPFAGIGLNPPSMQITITKLEPPPKVEAKVI